jgi:hypothetical protein
MSKVQGATTLISKTVEPYEVSYNILYML